MFKCISGQNPVDIAAAFADPRVYDIVRVKFDSLPQPKDNKKGGKGKGKGGNRPKSGAGTEGKVGSRLVVHSSTNNRSGFFDNKIKGG